MVIALAICIGILFLFIVFLQLREIYIVKKLFSQGDYKKLETKFKKMIINARTNSIVVSAYQNLIAVYTETNRYNDAHECIAKVNELGISNALLKTQESSLLCKEGRYDEAQTVINEALKHKHISKQHKIILLNNLIDIMINTNKITEATNMLGDLLNKHPQNPILLATLGDLYIATKNFDNAKEAYTKVLMYSKEQIYSYSLRQYAKKQLNFIENM